MKTGVGDRRFDRTVMAVFRGVWWLYIVLAAALFAAGIILQFSNGFFQMPSTQAMTSVPILVRILTENRFLASNIFYPFVLLAFYFQAIAFVSIGLLLFWRKSREVMGVLASLLFIAIGLGFTPTIIFLPLLSPAWHLPTSVFQAGLFSAAFLFLCLFPNGRFFSKNLRYAVVFWVVYTLFWLPFPQLNPHRASSIWPSLIFVAVIWVGIVTQFIRYQSMSNANEKRQTQWVIAGFVAANFGLFMVALLIGFGNTKSTVFITFTILLLGLASIFIPLTITVALLRYRLWDIDVIIRKTAVYTVLTAVLALVYFGTIILLQGLVGRATGEQSPLIIVFSTLIIAALFAPLRQRIQAVIDRRFYRQKYDAQQVLAQFAITARDETDMDKLTAELVRVVQETMQPEQVSVWLKPVKGERPLP